MTQQKLPEQGSITAERNGAKSPFIAFIRANGERIQFSYASIHHQKFLQTETDGEPAYIYAAGHEITLKGKNLDVLADALLDCSATKITQKKEDNANSKHAIVTHMTWELATGIRDR